MSDRPRCRVLVVEDEAMIAMLVEDMILDFGSEVVGPAAQMDEALRLARQGELDAAILDINVGGAVVFPVAEVLREAGGKALEGPEICVDYSPGYYAFFFEDPDGNKLEICCRESPIIAK